MQRKTTHAELMIRQSVVSPGERIPPGIVSSGLPEDNVPAKSAFYGGTVYPLKTPQDLWTRMTDREKGIEKTNRASRQVTMRGKPGKPRPRQPTRTPQDPGTPGRAADNKTFTDASKTRPHHRKRGGNALTSRPSEAPNNSDQPPVLLLGRRSRARDSTTIDGLDGADTGEFRIKLPEKRHRRPNPNADKGISSEDHRKGTAASMY